MKKPKKVDVPIAQIITRTGRSRPDRINIKSEVWKFMNNRETLMDAENILFLVGREWLEMVKAKEARTGVDELERIYRLEDTRS